MVIQNADFLIATSKFSRLIIISQWDRVGEKPNLKYTTTLTIDRFADHSIDIELFFYEFEDRKNQKKVVVFYECVSTLCHSQIIEMWLRKNFTKTIGNEWAHCNDWDAERCWTALKIGPAKIKLEKEK